MSRFSFAPADPAPFEAVVLPWWARAISIAPAVTAVLVIAQRWNEPDRVRSIVLATAAALVIGLRHLLCRLVPSAARMPQFLWYLPVDAAVLALIWYPVDSDVAPFFLALVAIYAAVDAAPFDGLLVMMLSLTVMFTAEASGRFTGAWVWALAIVLSWIGGRTLRWALTLLHDLNAAQTDLAERATLDERQRIAREIHDVLAHSLSIATLHITGARMALKRDPNTASGALEEAERLTRESLTQVRSVIGMLTPATDGTAPAMPTAEDIPVLVADFRSAGVLVDLSITGDLTALPPTVGLALYRVTQESLSNAVRHAPGQPAAVCIVANSGSVELEVTNRLGSPVPASAAGRGIVGMSERAAALGGTLVAGPEREHWRVRMVSPTVADCA